MRWLRGHCVALPNERSLRFARRGRGDNPHRRHNGADARCERKSASDEGLPVVDPIPKALACHGACVTSTGITLWSS